ncbi:MAG TPA: hypothetical protein VFV41_01055 [Streptosporangiaceae bacterium]|nr:hypothetical protein [Streptosporangiaceae bacterium]
MLVTPWFAAGAGFVIAAALALNSPHTVLTYRPHMTPCTGGPCAVPGALPTAQPGVQLKRAKPAHVSGPPSRTQDGTGPLVGYRVVWKHDGEFAAMITIPARRAQHGWDLSFRFPGRHVAQVWGAVWRPSPSGDGGVASVPASGHGHAGPSGGQGWPGRDGGSGDSGDSGWQGASGPAAWNAAAGQSSAADGYGGSLRFLVAVQGSPATPVDCVLNQHACHFG